MATTFFFRAVAADGKLRSGSPHWRQRSVFSSCSHRRLRRLIMPLPWSSTRRIAPTSRASDQGELREPARVHLRRREERSRRGGAEDVPALVHVEPETGRRDLRVLECQRGQGSACQGCASRNGEDNRYAASFIKLADGTIQRVGQDVEGIFGTKVWR